MKPRVAVLFDNLGPYHMARLAAAAQRVHLLAVEQKTKSAEYEWNPVKKTPFARVTLLDPTDALVNLRVERAAVSKALDDFQPEVIAIPGWSSRQAKVGLMWALEHAVPVVVMSDSQEIDFPRSRYKEWLKSRYIALCAAGLVGGTPHLAYLSKLGMPPSQIQTGYDVVDNAYFERCTNELRTKHKELAKELGLVRPFFLCAARFVEKKNLPTLIKAFAQYRDMAMTHHTLWDLVILGDGSLRTILEMMAKERTPPNSVHFPGFIQYAELPRYYGAASCFVLPSTTEQWGLVVNEAMASGLPVLVSERCGCAQDLVENGKNGFTFNPYDVDELARLMMWIASPDCDRVAMGTASLEIIDRWSPETFASGLEAAVQTALQSQGRPAGLLDHALLHALAHR